MKWTHHDIGHAGEPLGLAVRLLHGGGCLRARPVQLRGCALERGSAGFMDPKLKTWDDAPIAGWLVGLFHGKSNEHG
jgi:hypothetical protein